MTAAFYLFLAEITAFFIVLRYLYYRFVLPATASKCDWYIEYMKLCDCIDKVDSYEALNVALDYFYQFTATVKHPDSIRKHYTHIAVKKLKGKFFMYRERLVTI